MDVAENVQDLGREVGIAEFFEHREGPQAIVEGLVVLPGLVGEEALDGQCDCFTIDVVVAAVEIERRFSMGARLLVAAQQGGVPRCLVECAGFPFFVVECPKQM